MKMDSRFINCDSKKSSGISTSNFDESDLRLAISNKRFALHYQPQINLISGEVVGFEGLLRWRHPEDGLKLPEAFIQIAEETDTLSQITHLVIDTGLEFIEKLNSSLSFSLHVPCPCIKDHQLLEMLNSGCYKFHINPHRIVLELEKASLLENAISVENILTELRMNGFRVAMENAGSNDSKVPHLDKLHISEVKIDKSLVTTMEASSKSRKSIISIIELAESLGVETIAEGIESDLEAIGLRELGCKVGQGHYFADPMDEVETLRWLEAWNKNLGELM